MAKTLPLDPMPLEDRRRPLTEGDFALESSPIFHPPYFHVCKTRIPS